MNNPLLQIGRNGRLPDFANIRPEHVLPALESLLEDYRRGVERRFAADRAADWSMVEEETEWADALDRAWSAVSHLNSVADSEELREAYNKGLELITRHANWRQQHIGIFQAYKKLKSSPYFAGLTPVQQRIVELELRDFSLAGVALPPEQQSEYREISMRLSKLGAKFSENVLDATHAWTRHFDHPGALKGLPDTELQVLAGIAANHGKTGWMVDLTGPAFQAVMTYAEDRSLREEVYTAYATRASDQGPMAGQWDNGPVIREMLALRHRLAVLLGFGNYAEYALSCRMADSPQTVLDFLHGLARQAQRAAREQFRVLTRFADGQGARTPLAPWDTAFWSERYRQAELALSDEEMKPYFPLDRMIEALTHTAGCLFGIRLEADDTAPAWHPDVRYYWLLDANGRRFAGLYMDLFARRRKRGGAWMDVCLSRHRTDSAQQLPVAFLTCNFPHAVGDQPSLLTHDDMQTLFHEFGHCLHHLLTEVDWPQVGGINNVEWDAVELPSQLLENWCWDEQILRRCARHYRSGEPLPDDLLERLLRSRRFQKALFLMRQLEYAITDFRLHREYDPQRPRNPLDVLEEVRAEVAVVPAPHWNRFLNGFAHIFGGGYAAGYYSYLWAEQLAADAWEAFREGGALHPEMGERLRREILAAGASRSALESFIAFRGRAPVPQPLLENYGLLQEEHRDPPEDGPSEKCTALADTGPTTV